MVESSLGFALFKLNSGESLTLSDPKVIQQFDNFNSFKKILSLEACQIFHGHNVAFEALLEIREGKLPKIYSTFLKEHFADKKQASLVVEDKNLASLISEKLKLKAKSGESFMEYFRGIRTHLAKFLTSGEEEIDAGRVSRANLGIGHALARHYIQFDEKRQDKPIINAHSLLELMDKNLNIFAMRVKESYGWHFPELSKILTDNETYIKFVSKVGNKENLAQMPTEELAELVGEEALAHEITERSKTSTGNTLSEVDQASLLNFTAFVLSHYDFKRELQSYLLDEMNRVAPNITALLGESVGARLLTHAGGLGNLAKLPASTIQILGAEKALFRALKKKGSTPKYGLLFNSSYIGKADSGEKGKISRMLSNKCAMAARLDCYLEKPTAKFGEKFKELLEEKIEKKDEFELGKRNIEIMEELVEELTKDGEYGESSEKRVKEN